MIKAIIFDFDGVITESVSVKTVAFADMYRSYGKDVVEKVVRHHLENGGISRFEKFRLYHSRFLGVDLSDQEIEVLSQEFSRLVMEKVITAPYVKGAYEFLSENFIDYHLYISSGTPKEEIVEILEARGLMPFFKEVYGSPEKKNEHIRKILHSNNYNSHEVVFVGDAPSDRDAAKENHIHFVARVVPENRQLDDELNKINDLIALKGLLETFH